MEGNVPSVPFCRDGFQIRIARLSFLRSFGGLVSIKLELGLRSGSMVVGGCNGNFQSPIALRASGPETVIDNTNTVSVR